MSNLEFLACTIRYTQEAKATPYGQKSFSPPLR
jgi:hypothetical protein